MKANVGMAALEKRLSQAKKMNPMKKPPMRPTAKMDFGNKAVK